MIATIRYAFIILSLGIFSSCAEQFREIRGSENRGSAFIGGELTSSRATKRKVEPKGDKASPQQTIIPVEQTISVIEAQSTPSPNPIQPEIETVESNSTSVIKGQKGKVSEENKGSSTRILKKKKLSKPVKILIKTRLQWKNGYNVNGYLIALGIAGIISSIIGSWMLVFLLITEAMGALGILLLFILFLFAFMSSIWLIISPKLEYGNPLKKAAVAITATSVLLFLLFILGLILGIIV